MPLTSAGLKTLGSMAKTYGSKKKAKEVFYASINSSPKGGDRRSSGKLKGMEKKSTKKKGTK